MVDFVKEAMAILFEMNECAIQRQCQAPLVYSGMPGRMRLFASLKPDCLPT